MVKTKRHTSKDRKSVLINSVNHFNLLLISPINVLNHTHNQILDFVFNKATGVPITIEYLYIISHLKNVLTRLYNASTTNILPNLRKIMNKLRFKMRISLNQRAFLILGIATFSEPDNKADETEKTIRQILSYLMESAFISQA